MTTIRKNALLIQLEFPTWTEARPWTYSANFAIQEGLEASGFDCQIIPAIPSSPPAPSFAPWLQHAKHFCSGKRFDLVWVWLVHYDFDRTFLEWIASLSPIRIGYVMESLSYSEEENRFSPVTRRRAAVVEKQAQYLTHIVACDELDVTELSNRGPAKTLWCPAFVPERFILPSQSIAPNHVAAFHGTPYGHRTAWLEHPALSGRLVCPPSQPTDAQTTFDRLQAMSVNMLQRPLSEVEQFLPRYIAELRRIRLEEFSQWMRNLTQWACIVNLPGFAKCYGGRVLEAMAAGRPVLSWDIPGRPRNRAFFQDGRNILLFPADNPAVLADQIDRLLKDHEFAQYLAKNAYHTMLRHHSSEIRMRQILQWIESGDAPSFGAEDNNTTAVGIPPVVSSTMQPVPAQQFPVASTAESTKSIPTVSIIIPCFNQAQFLPEAVGSVVDQTFEDWECIIVDDGSPDETPQVAARIIAQYRDARIRLLRKPNGGLADARNAGIREAQGRYILPLDADDRLHPDYLQETTAILRDRQDIAIVYVDEQNFGESAHVHRKGTSNLSNLLQANVHDYCSLYRREVWEAAGGYSPAMYIGAEDWNFWITASKKGFRSYHLQRALFQYRNRPGTMVAQVQANIPVVKAHLTLHHPDLYSAADQANARRQLSQVSREQAEQLTRTRAIHPDNALLKEFYALAFPQPGENGRHYPEEGHHASIAQTVHPAAHSEDAAAEHDHDDAYYEQLFIQNPEWSTPHPNDDETSRWIKIASFLEHIVRHLNKVGHVGRLRILDLGCGRGWLTNLASQYGDCTGIEPVAAVVAHARRLFPHVTFHVGTADRLLEDAGFQPYDIVLSSEVIEHVPREHQPAFVQKLRRLVKPNGYVILTTPRGEVFDLWKEIAQPNQPVEDWLTEEDINQLFIENQYSPIGRDRVAIELPSFRFLPAPMPLDHQTRKLIPFYQVSAWKAPDQAGRPSKESSFGHCPMVTIIVPTHNRPDRLRTALHSILQQTFQDFEIVVVNDGDMPVEGIIAELAHKTRITYIKHSRNRGLAAARNTGLRVAQGKYIAYLDDDDRYLPAHLETLVSYLESHDCKVAYTDAWRVAEQDVQGVPTAIGRDQPYGVDFNPARLLVANYIPVLCLMHHKSCLDEVGPFDESLFVHEDWDLWIRLALRNVFSHIPKTTAEFTWRTDGSSMSSRDADLFYRTADAIYRKYSPYVQSHPNIRAAQTTRLEDLKRRVSHTVYQCSVIIPVWNNSALTRQCLTALAQVTEGVSFEVVIVDNGSTDGVQEFLQTLGGDVRIIRNQDNLGFAKACNQGARASRGEYLVFLNNDTIPLKGWLTTLVDEVCVHSDVAVVGSKLLYENGTIQHAGVAFSREWSMPYHIYRGVHADAPQVSRRRELQCVTAACMLVRRHVFEEVGGFDETYRNGFEDVDLCLKIRQKNWKVVYQPKSTLYHLESRTPGRKTHDQENSRRLQERWGSSWWLADEDRIHFDDGYALHTYVSDDKLAYRLRLIDDPKTKSERALVAEVQSAAQRQDASKVADLLRRVEEWPADIWILRWAALLCLGVMQPQLAIPFWRRVLALEDDPQARVALAKHALEAGLVDDAEAHVAALMKAKPAGGEGWLLSGIIAMQRKQYGEAERAFERAHASGTDRRKSSLGIVMAAMGANRPERAWDVLLPLCAHEPDDEECMHWLLRCGTTLERWDPIGERLAAFLGRNPGNTHLRFALAGVLLRSGRRVEAQRQYDMLRLLDPALEGLGELARELGDSAGRAVPQHAA